MTNTHLPVREARLYRKLHEPIVGADVPVAVLYTYVFDTDEQTDPTYMQQRLGPYITRLNRRIKAAGWRVCPGEIKRTYRLTQV